MAQQNPGPHPEPPANLADRQLAIITVASLLFRFHKSHRDPLHFGSSGNYRFDAPTGEYSILYLGADAHCAFVETFGHSTGINIVAIGDLSIRRLSFIEPLRPLQLVDLTGNGLARIGADERLCTSDYNVAQRWALALWRHPSQLDGLYYRARHDPSRFCVALFDRAADAVHVVRQQNLMSSENVGLLVDVLDTYGFGLIE